MVVSVDRRRGAVENEQPERLQQEAVDLTVPEDVEALWERLVTDGTVPRWLVNAVGGLSRLLHIDVMVRVVIAAGERPSE